jgi:hypothetical protein
MVVCTAASSSTINIAAKSRFSGWNQIRHGSEDLPKPDCGATATRVARAAGTAASGVLKAALLHGAGQTSTICLQQPSDSTQALPRTEPDFTPRRGEEAGSRAVQPNGVSGDIQFRHTRSPAGGFYNDLRAA